MSKSEILEIINSDRKAFYIGTRMILPFKCNLIKLIANSHIYTEFVGNNDIKVAQTDKNTSIYFRETGKLDAFEGSYKSIKIIIASEDDDLSNPKNFIKLICHILDDHEVELEIPSDNDIFII